MQELYIEELLASVDPNLHVLYAYDIASGSYMSHKSSDTSCSENAGRTSLPSEREVLKMTLAEFNARCEAYEFSYGSLKMGDRLFVRSCRRRITNREFSRKKRQQNKQALARLERQVVDLQSELAYLRDVVKHSELLLGENIVMRLREALQANGCVDPVKLWHS